MKSLWLVLLGLFMIWYGCLDGPENNDTYFPLFFYGGLGCFMYGTYLLGGYFLERL
jgi:hypothetical protein